MKNRVVVGAVRFVLPALFALVMFVVGPAQQGARRSARTGARETNRLLSRMMLPGSQDLKLIIELTSPSAVEWLQPTRDRQNVGRLSSANGRSRLDLDSSQSRAYRAQLAGEQGRVMKSLSAMSGVQVMGSVDTVMNALIVRIPARHYGRILRLPEVRKVYFSRQQKLLLDASATVLRAQGLWNKVGGNAQAGRGIKIGIIDTGIDITNPMFVDNSLIPPAGYPKGEFAYTNNKVIVARNYVSLLSNFQSVRTAVDESGHGTFVAAEAAGKLVAAPAATISGMAPEAFLGNYKVFGTPGINDTTTTDAVIAAVDAAVRDGMDVLNLSLGSLDYLPPGDDPEMIALENAINAGVVVVIAAGNDGPGKHSIGNPGGMPDAITVGSVSNSRYLASTLHVTTPAPVPAELVNVPYIPGTGPLIAADVSPTSVVDVASFDGNGLGCSAMPSSILRGKIAFIQRGTCLFSVKVSNAEAAEAAGVVLYNNVSGADPIVMAGLEGTAIPAVMVSNPAGEALKGFIASHPGAVLVQIDNYQTLTEEKKQPGVLSSFSSIGPAPDFGVKPDLVAVGERIYSATESTIPSGDLYSPNKFTVGQGTSFSAPLVAGTAAVLKQLFPGLSALAIKSMITSTASRELTVDGMNTADILSAGSGLLDMSAASAAVTVFTPTNLSFGVHSYSGSITLTRPLSIQNVSSTPDQYTVTVEPLVAGPVLQLSQNVTGTLAPGQSTAIELSLQAAAPLTGGFQGFLTVKSSATSTTYRIPYWAGLYVPDSSRILKVSKGNAGGGFFGSIGAAIDAARPGNIIEIADSSTYAEALTITTNAEGLPLHGLTIRAAAGQSPAIDGSTLNASQNIFIAGVQNVLLQGLRIEGGSIGIELLQPSVSVPLSATIDHCTISNPTEAGSFSSGIEIDGGGTVDVTWTTISGSSGDAIFVSSPGTYLTVLSSTIRDNSWNGIDAFFSNVQVLNSEITGNTGSGLYLDSCTGTIDQSTFVSQKSYIDPFNARNDIIGDGVELFGGSWTVTNSSFSSNDAAGLFLGSGLESGSGPLINMTNNTLSGNKDCGLQVWAGSDLKIDGNLLKDNGNGIYLDDVQMADVVNNIVVRSTGPTAGHPSDFFGNATGNGIEVATGQNIRVVNNTLYMNATNGISVSPSGSVSVHNSIVHSNQGGDLHGISPGALKNSLLGVDPQFADPNAGDFSLRPGSPALDSGSNSAPGLPFLDYYRRLRVAGGAASPIVDIGAIEADSSYPLVFPLLANGNQPALQNNVTTGVALLNYGTSASPADFTAFDAGGGLLAGSANPASKTISGSAQVPILGYQLFGFGSSTASLGAVLARSLARMAGFFLIFDADFKTFANGTSVSDRTAEDLIFMRHLFDASGSTTYALFNPGMNPANVMARLISPGGTAIGASRTATVPPKGQFVFGFDDVTTAAGYVRVQSDRPVSGLELYGKVNELAVLGGVSPGSESRLFFPHVVFNHGYTTFLGAINSGDAPATLILRAFDNSGQSLADPVTVPLDPSAQVLEDAAQLFGIAEGPMVTGYVVAQSDHPGIEGFTAFRYDDGIHSSEAAVPVDSVPRQRLLFSHVAHQVAAGSGVPYLTGVSLLNPFGAAIDYQMKVYDAQGNLVAQKEDTLGPYQKVAKILSYPEEGVGFFTQPLPLSGGHIDVTTDYRVFGFELFFTEDLSQLASVPAQPAD